MGINVRYTHKSSFDTVRNFFFFIKSFFFNKSFNIMSIVIDNLSDKFSIPILQNESDFEVKY